MEASPLTSVMQSSVQLAIKLPCFLTIYANLVYVMALASLVSCVLSQYSAAFTVSKLSALLDRRKYGRNIGDFHHKN